MEILFPLIAVLVLLSFLFKGSFLPRWEAAAVSLALAVFVWLAIPWLTRQTAGTIEQWTSDPSRVLDGAVCLVLEVAVMILFCFTAPAGRFRFLRFIRQDARHVACLRVCGEMHDLPQQDEHPS